MRDNTKICADLHVTLVNCSYSETNADVSKCANLKKPKDHNIVSLVTNLNNKNNVCKKLCFLCNNPVTQHESKNQTFFHWYERTSCVDYTTGSLKEVSVHMF